MGVRKGIFQRLRAFYHPFPLPSDISERNAALQQKSLTLAHYLF